MVARQRYRQRYQHRGERDVLFYVYCRTEDGRWGLQAIYKDKKQAEEKARTLERILGRPCRVVHEV